MNNSITTVNTEELNKFKRKVFNNYSRVNNVRNEIADISVIGVYNENDWMATLAVDGDSDEIRDIMDVLQARFNAASDLESALTRKSRLQRLQRSEKGLSAKQTSALESSIEDVSELSRALSELPDAGCTFEEWKEVGVRRIGHPTRALEQELIRYKLDMDDSLSVLNKMEKEAGLRASTIESLTKEQDTFVRNGGRKAPPSSVADVEKLDTEFRRIKGLYNQDLAKPEAAFQPSSTGRKPKSKTERLADYQAKLDALQAEITQKEAKLQGLDLIERTKKVIERKRRYAKSDGLQSKYDELSSVFEALKSLEKRIFKEVSEANLSQEQVNSYSKEAIEKILGGEFGKAEEFSKPTVQSVASTLNDKGSEDEDASIEELMNQALASFG
jgi:hypothetical protein